MSLKIEHVQSPTDDAKSLINELDAELIAPYLPEQHHGLSIEQVFQPNVRFFIARLDGLAVGCGAIAVENDLAELKRMYVRTAARQRGVAQAILSRLQHEAGALGVTRLVLETGDVQYAAIRFYEQAGFTRCDAFGAYTALAPLAIERSVFFQKAMHSGDEVTAVMR